MRLEGRVVDAEGAGTRATVWLDSEPPRSVATEEDGTFAFEHVVGRDYQLFATAGDRVGGPIAHHLTASSDPVVVRLVASARVLVMVTDDDGAAVANATLRLDDFADVGATTDATGKATLSPVRPGLVSVEVSAGGYATAHGVSQVGSPGASAKLDVKLHRGVAVSGRVVDEAGKGLTHVRVTAGEALWWMPAIAGQATTNEQGEFKIAALAAGTHVLTAKDDDHAPGRSAPVTVTRDAVSGVTIELKEGGTIAGKVVDARGASVPFATIRIAQPGAELSPGRQATADRQGEFLVRGLPRTRVQVRAVSEEASSKLLDLDLSPRALARDVRLVVDETGTITGVVADERGQPIPEIQVTATADYLSNERATLAGVSSGTTNGAGEFTIRGLSQGSYRVRAVRPSGGSRPWETPGVVAKPGDTNVKVTLPAAATLAGKVALESGKPPALATVQIGYHVATPVAADGSFRIEELMPGSYDLRVVGPEFAELAQRDVKLDAGKVTDLGTLTVFRGRTLVGRVLDASGAPVVDARVTVARTLVSMEGADDQVRNIEDIAGARVATTDRDGAFTIIGIAKTRAYAGAVSLERGRANPVEIAEGAEDPAPITLALRAFGSIRGKVTSKGQPLGGVSISDRLEGSTAQVQLARSSDDGSFVLDRVPSGKHVLGAMQTQGMSSVSTSATVEVAPGATATATLDIPVGAVALTVQVEALPSNKLDAAQVFMFRGAVDATTGKQVNEAFAAGGMQGMKFWFGAGKPMPEFAQLVPAVFSVCGVPIAGNLSDSKFQQRLQQNLNSLVVVCKRVTVAASPEKQSIVLALPSMPPLP